MKPEIIAWVFAALASGLAVCFAVSMLKFKRLLRESIEHRIDTLKRRWAAETELAFLKGEKLVEDAKTLDERTAALNQLLARLK